MCILLVLSGKTVDICPILAQCYRSLLSMSFSGKVILLACTFYDGLVAVQGIRIIIITHTLLNLYKLHKLYSCNGMDWFGVWTSTKRICLLLLLELYHLIIGLGTII
jgi:hypothetical protein